MSENEEAAFSKLIKYKTILVLKVRGMYNNPRPKANITTIRLNKGTLLWGL